MLCSACLSPVVAWRGGGEDVARRRQPSLVGTFLPDLCRNLSPDTIWSIATFVYTGMEMG
ncbi:hypothetical protein A2U01_0067243 [Trifolium medium]|uniref:Uncharacterized protein n=1 Tax=Trifolium medium TaxID=97028 RepID=A0A392SAM5_9FABA|nr:hypothetical protein [Trifolium medium]